MDAEGLLHFLRGFLSAMPVGDLPSQEQWATLTQAVQVTSTQPMPPPQGAKKPCHCQGGH